MNDQYVTYDRTALYDKVWRQPVRDVAKEYGVSDVALAKTCRRLDVPLPGRGYWAKKVAGKAGRRPLLPPHDGPSTIVVRRGAAKEAAERAARIAGKEIPLVPVPTALRRPHPLIVATRDVFPTTGARDVIHSARPKGSLDLKVSRELLGRALRILDMAIKALESRGFLVQVGPEVRNSWGERDWRWSFETYALVGKERVAFALRELQRMERIPPSPSDRERGWPWDRETVSYRASGVLELALTNERLRSVRRTWKDGKRQRLEDCLGSFVVHVEVTAEKLAEIHAEDERRARKRREEQERRGAAVRRQREEERRTKVLLERVSRWRQAEDIRCYVAAVKGRIAELDLSDEDRWRFDQETLWSLELARRIDPIKAIESLDPLLVDEAEWL